MCHTLLNQLKKVQEAKNSIINSFNSFVANKSYEDGIKAITKASDFFIDKGKKDEAEEILEFSFEGVVKYYHVITLNEAEMLYMCSILHVKCVWSRNVSAVI